uniref:Retrotransposon gag domain-containing protein n=1 Tax=Fagus sylvatica TaxID=28930 RepID=A0A2N9FDF3_FAGSY
MAILSDFRGLENENPYVHVRAFEEVIGSFYAQNVIETAKLRFFPFSLKDKAKGWLYTLKPRSIGSWGEMTQEFYKKFFPPHKVQQVKRKISNFAQGNDETLFMAWERFKDTYNFCPTHGYDTWRLVSYFYEGLQPRDRQFVQVACGGGFLQKEPEDAMDYLDEIAENSNTWNGPSPLDSTYRNRSSTTTSDGNVFRLREEDNMNAKISLLTKEIEALKLKGSRGINAVYREDPMEACRICQEIDRTTSACKSLSQFLNVLEEQKQGEQNQRFDTMFTRIDEEMRETKSQVARLTEALSRTERGKLPSQTQPNPNNQTAKVVNTDKFEEVKSITILRSGKEIRKDAPKANEKSKETSAEKDESGITKSNDIEKCPFPTPFPQALKLPKNLDVTSEILEYLHQIKVNLPLLHLIKQMPFYAKVSAIIQHKFPPKYKDPGCPTISCTIGDYNIERALLDLGASVNLLPFSVYLQLGLGELKPTSVTLQLADRSVRKSRGVVEDVLITFGSIIAELNIFNVNPQQLVDEECEYVNFIEILEEEQVVVAKKPPRSKKKSLHAYLDAPKLKLKQPPRDLPCASIEPHATSTVKVHSKESVNQEVEKAGEKTKFFERHKTKRKVLQNTRLSKKLLNSSKGVALHVARMKSARGSNYSFGGSRSEG